MRVALEKPRTYGRWDKRDLWWKEAKPFVLNDRAILIHRPRQVTLYNIHKGPHIGISLWCGNQFTGLKKFTFLDSPPEDRLVCHACEQRALMAGLPSSSELAGKHVCVGKLKAVNTCHIHGAAQGEVEHGNH